ncbi:unnamed protein product [Prunus armeniaca]
MRPKPPPFDLFSPIPHRPLHMGIKLWVWGKSLGCLDGLEDEEVRWAKRRVHLELGLVGDEEGRRVVGGCLSTTKGNQWGSGEGLGVAGLGGGWGGAGVLGSWAVADLCRRKEVHLHLWSPENSIKAAEVAPLLMHGSCSMKCASELRCCALLLNEMMEDGVDPIAFTYSSSLKACARWKTVLHWKLIHSSSNRSPAMSNVFDSMPERNLVSWKAMIVGYVKNGLCQEAMKLMYRMRTEGFEVDDYILATVLTACGDLLI